MIFYAFGHPKISAKHRTTLEFTKSPSLTKAGDCILGVNSDFDPDSLIRFIQNRKILSMAISAGQISDELTFTVNPGFRSREELVIRKSDFISERTLGTNADKACTDINRDLIKKLRNKEKIKIQLYEKDAK